MLYSTHAAVTGWLASIPLPTTRKSSKRPRSHDSDDAPRKRNQPSVPISSSPSTQRTPFISPPSSDMVIPSGKRPLDALGTERPGDLDVDESTSSHPDEPEFDFPTPKPSALQRKVDSARGSRFSVASSSTNSVASQSTSGRSSPTKRIRRAQVEETEFTRANFTIDQDLMPACLSTMLRCITEIANGRGILPVNAKPELSFPDIPDDAFIPEDSSRLRGARVPSSDFVRRILRRAVRCDFEQEAECSWNQEVQSPLLAWICRPNEEEGLVDFRYCTTAGVLKAWKPSNVPSTMVDYCMIIRPRRGGDDAMAIAALKADRPGDSINHTDWGNLVQDPIVVSIETKSQSGDGVKATFQMAMWQASQWRSLRHLDPDAWKGELAFLPGILVQGHEWWFVASIPGESGKPSTYFDKLPIGTTSSPFGICKILATLEYLRSWAEERFWPAYRVYLLQTDL